MVESTVSNNGCVHTAAENVLILIFLFSNTHRWIIFEQQNSNYLISDLQKMNENPLMDCNPRYSTIISLKCNSTLMGQVKLYLFFEVVIHLGEHTKGTDKLSVWLVFVKILQFNQQHVAKFDQNQSKREKRTHLGNLIFWGPSLFKIFQSGPK